MRDAHPQVLDPRDGLDDLFELVAGRFGRVEPRRRARAYVRELLKSPPPSRLAGAPEKADGVRRLLNCDRWNADDLRDDVRTHVVRRIGDVAAALIIDELGFRRMGSTSAGVALQSAGRSDRPENCQVGLFAGYTSALGQTLIDRELFLPEEWLADRERRDGAGIPQTVTFRSRPELARAMIERVVAAGTPLKWIAVTSAVGEDGTLAKWCQTQGLPHIVAVHGRTAVSVHNASPRVADAATTAPAAAWTATGKHRVSRHRASSRSPEQLAAEIGCPPPGECSPSFEWAVGSIQQPEPVSPAWLRWLLVRRAARSVDGPLPADPPPSAYFVGNGPASTTDGELIRLGCALSDFGACLETAQRAAGLGRYRARRYAPWYRHMTLSLLALASITMPPNRPPGRPAQFSHSAEIVWHV